MQFRKEPLCWAGMFVIMTAVVIVVSIWQAAGLTMARVRKITLDQRDE
jgi:hypothetical protein